MGDGVAALLARPWELAARQRVLQAGVDLAEGEQFRPVGNALVQQLSRVPVNAVYCSPGGASATAFAAVAVRM